VIGFNEQFGRYPLTLRRLVKLFVAIILASGLLAAQSSAPIKEREPRFSIAINAPSNTVKPGSQITVNATLTNKAKDTIYLDASAPWMAELDFRVEVHDVQGNLAPLTDYGRLVLKNEGEVPIVENNGSLAVLHPGDTFKREIVVSKLYDLTQPGKYTIQAQRPDDANGTIAKSNTVNVTVTPQ